MDGVMVYKGASVQGVDGVKDGLCAGDHSSPPSLKQGNWLHYTDPTTLGRVIYVLSIST